MREVERSWAATTFLARDLNRDDVVTLRVLEPMLVAHLNVAGFLHETQQVQSLTHPHIVQLRDSGEVEGIVYCAMQWVDGGTWPFVFGRRRSFAMRLGAC